ncbi:hypothetical protein B0H14DRAFT_2563409 [Mycena olivaceomarginata]|nr:hypothetical protein B0H14DRAFT_2563409 [Mycena olivaceomarginata]
MALHRHFIQDGFRLSALERSQYGSAYLQIRQALVIETWAGIKPGTYGNNRTFATIAGAALQFLRHRNAADVQAQSSDVRLKEAHFRDFLGGCFAHDLLPDDWESSDSSPESLKIGYSTVVEVKAKLELFSFRELKPYKRATFTPC